jgi:hypothetical protein
LEAPVIVANIEDDIIVSTTQLSASNHWTIHPPVGVYPGVGVIVLKHNEIGKYGKLMTIGNEDMYSDPTTWNRFDIDVKIPDLSPIMQLQDHTHNEAKRSPKWMTISRIQGMERLTSKEQVLFQQRIWFASKNRMIWYIDNIPSFPLKKSQLELHFNPDEVGKIRGHFTKRSHHSANVYDQSEEEEMKVYERMSSREVIQDQSKKSHHREEIRNMVIGYETGSDIVPGPNNKSYRAIFVDKATGFKWSASLPKKSHLPEAFTQYCEFMHQHGHVLTNLKTDDEALYKTPVMKQLYKRFISNATHSSPDIHQWNGLAEASNRKSGNMVTSMLSCARHLSEVFWSKAWEQADLIHSLGPCSIKGKENITRYEAVRKIKPDLNAIVMLPFGQPVEFHIPKDQRGRFFDKTRRGSYITGLKPYY